MKKIRLLVSCLCLAAPLSAEDFLPDLKISYLEEAAQNQKAGDLLSARNAWYKYARLQELEAGEISADELQRIRSWMAELREKLWPSAQITSAAPVTYEAKPSRPVTRLPAPVRLSAKDLMKKADLLKANGQLEEALRFYKLAESAKPDAETRKKISEIEKEMN